MSVNWNIKRSFIENKCHFYLFTPEENIDDKRKLGKTIMFIGVSTNYALSCVIGGGVHLLIVRLWHSTTVSL